MKWRVIVRMSLDGDNKSLIGNEVAGTFDGQGITRGTKTGSYEGQVSPSHAFEALRNVIYTLANTSSAADSTVCLDHLWIYVDRAPD